MIDDPITSARMCRAFWGMLDRPDRRALLSAACAVTYDADTQIFKEGEPPALALVIRHGWVKIVRGPVGRRQTALALRTAGDLVGESASADQPRIATVIALGEVKALIISAPGFLEFLRDHPEAERAMQRTRGERQSESDRKCMDFAKVASSRRLAQFFLELADRVRGAEGWQQEVVLDLPLSQVDISDLICASTSTVERTLRNWRQRGIVETSRREYRLLDLSALRRIAGSA